MNYIVIKMYKDNDCTIVTPSYPMSKESAEKLADVYSELHPDYNYVVAKLLA